jgi:hypothetical protein
MSCGNLPILSLANDQIVRSTKMLSDSMECILCQGHSRKTDLRNLRKMRRPSRQDYHRYARRVCGETKDAVKAVSLNNVRKSQEPKSGNYDTQHQHAGRSISKSPPYYIPKIKRSDLVVPVLLTGAHELRRMHLAYRKRPSEWGRPITAWLGDIPPFH